MTASPGKATDARRVVYVIGSMVTGGTQTHLLQVLRFLDRSRFEPRLFVLVDGGDLIEAARALDVPVATFGMRGTLKHPRDFGGLARMVGALRELRPALVHGYLLRGNFFAATAARLARVPVVATSKRGLHQPAGVAERLAVRVSNSLSDAVTGNSPQVLEFTRRVEGRVPEPLVMIPSGIDTTRFDPELVDPAAGARLRAELGIGDAPLVGSTTTFKAKKGFRLLFESMRELLRQVPEAHLAVAGESDLGTEPAELVRRLGLQGRIHPLGRRSDMPEVLSALDVFVLPSESEGMSNALLEAMAMKLPVVATAVGGNVAVVEEGRSGMLVAYPDAAAMAARVAGLLGDPGRRAQMGTAARRRVLEHYSAPAMVRQMEDLYVRLLDGKDR